ncbi:MAG: hypothetical protein ACO398_10690, partial [Kiritimatiellia bacterium]
RLDEYMDARISMDEHPSCDGVKIRIDTSRSPVWVKYSKPGNWLIYIGTAQEDMTTKTGPLKPSAHTQSNLIRAH